MDLGLAGRVAVVAASSQGIGRAVACRFAAEGARVVINGRREDVLREAEQEIAAAGAEVEAVVADLSSREGCERLVQRSVERFGAIDALVTNAGGPPSRPFADLDDEDWRNAFELTMMSTVRLTRAALPYLQAARGCIVNITSISVKQPIPGLVLSNSIRPGVVGLGKTLAEELAAGGIRVNDVAPGSVWTERQEYLVKTRAERQNVSVEDEIARVEAAIPLKRFGTAQEVANVVVFLCSPASGYVTGSTVLVDGGAYKGLM